MQLTQKESTLLKDLKGQEQLCVDKYTKYAESANDPQLKQLFTVLAGIEQGHLNTITQMESGTVPSTSSGQAPTWPTPYRNSNVADKKNDTYLCSDVLAGEKHVSSLYDTCIFEFSSPEMRQVLNHIQTEEQQHGEQIYQYMKANQMYG